MKLLLDVKSQRVQSFPRWSAVSFIHRVLSRAFHPDAGRFRFQYVHVYKHKGSLNHGLWDPHCSSIPARKLEWAGPLHVAWKLNKQFLSLGSKSITQCTGSKKESLEVAWEEN